MPPCLFTLTLLLLSCFIFPGRLYAGAPWPQAICKEGVTFVDLDESGNYQIQFADIDDGTLIDGRYRYEISPESLDCFSPSNTPVTLTIYDESDNYSSCIAAVTAQDVTPPQVTCSNDFTVYLDASGNASININDLLVSYSDNCDGMISFSLDRETFSCADLGSNTVKLTAQDYSFNEANCFTTVYVLDKRPPVIDQCAGGKGSTEGWAETGSTTPAPDFTPDVLATDNCDTPHINQYPAATAPLPTGTNNISLTATDLSGNTSTCLVSYVVHPVNQPVIQFESESFTFPTEEQFYYAIDYTEVLNSDPPSWTTLTNLIPGTSSNLSIHDPAPAATNRFYRSRILLPPYF